jgi:hypothetical protein
VSTKNKNEKTIRKALSFKKRCIIKSKPNGTAITVKIAGANKINCCFKVVLN